MLVGLADYNGRQRTLSGLQRTLTDTRCVVGPRLHPARSARRVDAQEHRSAAEDVGLDVQGMGSIKNAVAADNQTPGLSPKFRPWASPTRLDKASDTQSPEPPDPARAPVAGGSHRPLVRPSIPRCRFSAERSAASSSKRCHHSRPRRYLSAAPRPGDGSTQRPLDRRVAHDRSDPPREEKPRHARQCRPDGSTGVRA